MKNLKNYAILLGVISGVIVVVQLLASIFNFPLDINLIVEVISIVLAVLVTFGVINKKDSANQDFDKLKEDIKQDLQQKIEDSTIDKEDDLDTIDNEK